MRGHYIKPSVYEEHEVDDFYQPNDDKPMNQFSKSVLLRFLRGGVAGAAGSMLVINLSGTNSFADLKVLLASLAVSGAIGFISGFLQAIDKFYRGGV